MLTKEAIKISSKNKICSLGLKMSLRHHLLPQIDCASYTHVNSENPFGMSSMHPGVTGLTQTHNKVVDAGNTNNHRVAGGACLPLSCQALAG